MYYSYLGVKDSLVGKFQVNQCKGTNLFTKTYQCPFYKYAYEQKFLRIVFNVDLLQDLRARRAYSQRHNATVT